MIATCSFSGGASRRPGGAELGAGTIARWRSGWRRQEDAEAIRAIYNVEVLGSTVTFDLVPRTRAEQEAWIEHGGVHPAMGAPHPAVVAVEGPRGSSGLRLAVAVPRPGRLLHDGGGLPLRRPGLAGQGGGAAAARRAAGPGLGPGVPHRDRPHPGHNEPSIALHRRAASSWWASSARWGASSAGGSTSPSCSGCCEPALATVADGSDPVERGRVRPRERGGPWSAESPGRRHRASRLAVEGRQRARWRGHSTRRASATVSGSAWNRPDSSCRPAGSPMKGATMDEPHDEGPDLAGGHRRQHDEPPRQVPGLDHRARGATMTSIVMPMARSAPIRSRSQQQPDADADGDEQPDDPGQRQLVCSDTPIPTRWARSVRKMPAAGGGRHPRPDGPRGATGSTPSSTRDR